MTLILHHNKKNDLQHCKKKKKNLQGPFWTQNKTNNENNRIGNVNSLETYHKSGFLNAEFIGGRLHAAVRSNPMLERSLQVRSVELLLAGADVLARHGGEKKLAGSERVNKIRHLSRSS